MTSRQRRPKESRGPVDWGTGRSDKSSGPDTSSGSPPSGPDWGVGRGPAPQEPTPGQRARTPWPAAMRWQRLAGVVLALLGLVTATSSAMNLAENAEAGHLWIPPWLVAVLGGAGLVAAAGYLAWAGGTPVRHEAQRWQPRVLDAAAGLTTGKVEAADPTRLLSGGPHPGSEGAASAASPGSAPGHPGSRTSAQAPWVSVDSGPRPIMGASTVEQSVHAPAGVAGAIGGFMMAGAVVCAVIALALGAAWLIATGVLFLGGVVATRLAAVWLGAA